MDKLTVDDVKKIEFDILTYIDKVCQDNNIEYYLFYGTLLGAVRHKGFIPWDDDIDIVVPVDKYEELCTLLSNQGERYKVFSSKLNEDYPYSFAKCVDTETLIYEKGMSPIQGLGIYVDIFPLYRCPEGVFGRKLFIKRLDILCKLSWQGAMKELNGPEATSCKEKMLRAAASLCNWRRIHKRLINRRVKCKRWSYCVKTVNSIKVFAKEWFTSQTLLPFDGGTFSAPGDYDKVLRTIYKDYMKLPPMEKRVLRHGFEAYRK